MLPVLALLGIVVFVNSRFFGKLLECSRLPPSGKRGYSQFTHKISRSAKALYRFLTVGYMQECTSHLMLLSEDDLFLFGRVEKKWL